MKLGQLLATSLAGAAVTPAAVAQTWESCGAIYSWDGEGPRDQFGLIVRSAGDTDGDGIEDIVAGAPTNSAGGFRAGRGYVYSGADGSLRFTITGSPGENLGYFAHCAGDVNADGFDDVVFGAPDVEGILAGAAYVVSGIDGSILYALSGETAGDQFGRTVNGVGDVDADGHDDIGIGASRFSGLGPGRGRAYIISGADGSTIYQFDGTTNGDWFGSGIATLSDRNGDGHDDFIIGADQGFVGRGRAYVYDGATGQRIWTLRPPSSGAVFGRNILGTVGDLNGDAVPDFFVSDFADSSLRGRIRVYDGDTFAILYEIVGDAAGDTLGTGSGRAEGDFDGDGVDDLLFGALGAGGQGRGQVCIFSGVDGEPLGTFNSDVAGSGFGFAAAGLGDVDGDSWPDFVAGSPTFGGLRGGLHVISGRPSPPRATCTGGVNSTGNETKLRHRRSLSLAINELQLEVSGAPINTLGVFVFGAQGVAPGGSANLMCVAAPWFRASGIAPTDASGSVALDIDLSTQPFASGASAVTAGSTWHFQYWCRDAAGSSSFNASNGLRVTFCP